MTSLKSLKSVAHSIAHHLASTLCYWENDYAINHLANAAKNLQVSIVIIDVHNQKANPVEIQSGMIAEIIPYLNQYLNKLLFKEGFTTDVITAASLEYNFGVNRINLYNIPTYDCISSITTNDGRVYSAHLTEASN